MEKLIVKRIQYTIPDFENILETIIVMILRRYNDVKKLVIINLMSYINYIDAYF